jgi:hypothetical protein
MPPNRTQSQTWFVEFRLAMRVNDGITPSDAEIQYAIKEIMDMANTCRRIRSLQRVSFAYKFGDYKFGEPARPNMAVSQATIVDIVGFEHYIENVRETTIQSWIQDPRVIGQRWTPVTVPPGAGRNWMQQDIIRNFFANCENGCRVRLN